MAMTKILPPPHKLITRFDERKYTLKCEKSTQRLTRNLASMHTFIHIHFTIPCDLIPNTRAHYAFSNS